MQKKPNLNELMSNVPSPKSNYHKFMAVLFIALGFSIFIYVSSVTYTGLAIMDSGSEVAVLKNQNIIVSNRFELMEIEKLPNSVLDASIRSDVLLNVFAETSDCQYWRNGQDKDNTVLYAINGVKEGAFKIGDPSEKTAQQIELYKSSNLCLIFINKEFPQNGNVNLQYREIDVNKWKII